MATYSNIGIKLITTGDESGTWGDTTNTNFSDILDEAIAGAVTYNIASDADATLTVSDGSSSDGRHAVINFTSTTLTATRTITFAPDTLQKTWLVINSTTGGQSLTFKQGSAGATVTVPNGESAIIYSDGAGATNGAITKALDSFTNTKITTGTLNATTLDLTNLEVTNVKAKDGTAALTIADSTGKVTVSSELAVDNLNLSGNAITSTDTNGNIDLTPNGTGEVNITKVDIDSGAIDGTAIGASSASTGAFTTLSASSTVTLSGGTANGVLYLNGSKEATSGSALTFDGSSLGLDNATISDRITLGRTASTDSTNLIRSYRGAFTSQYSVWGNSGGATLINTEGGGGTVWQVDGTEKMRLGGTATTGGVGAVGIGYSTLTSASDSGLVVAGNVGIGTSSPGFPLQVVKAGVTFSGNFKSIADFRETSAAVKGMSIGYDDTSQTATFISTTGSAGSNFSWVTWNGSAWGERARITSGGDLLVGTTSADGRATIEGAGTYTLSLNNTATDVRIRLKQSGTEYGQVSAGTDVMNLVATGASTNMRFITNSTERARIDSSGHQIVGYTASVGTAYQPNIQVKGSSASNYGAYGVISSNNELLGMMGVYSNGENSLWLSADPDNLRTGSRIVFAVDATDRMTLDSYGNLGLGVTPSVWIGYKAIQIGQNGAVSSAESGTVTMVNSNCYFDGSSYKYISSAEASLYQQASGAHNWRIAPSGTAGTTATLTQAMTLTADGDLLLGPTTGLGTTRRELVLQSANGSILNLGINGVSDSFQLVCDSGPNALIINKSNTPMIFYTNNTERARIDSSGLLGIGNTVASTINAANGLGKLVIGGGTGSEGLTIYSGTGSVGGIAFADGTTSTDTYRGYVQYAHGTDYMAFWTAATERARIDSSGNLGLGVTPSAWGTVIGLQVRNANISDLGGTSNNSNFGSNWYYDGTNFKYLSSASATNIKQLNGAFQFLTAPSDTAGNNITFTEAMTLDASSNLAVNGTVSLTTDVLFRSAAGQPTRGSISMNYSTGEWGFSAGVAGTTYFQTFSTNGSERARITSGGSWLVGTTDATPATSDVAGFAVASSGITYISADANPALYINRKTNDGELVRFYQAGAQEGSISVSGNTVSYNPFMGSHYTEIVGEMPTLKGTVLESLDELVTGKYGNQDRLPKAKISDTVGSKAVYGVYFSPDSSPDTDDGILAAALGASWVRVNGSVTVQKGDLLESNGDGTARVQADDLIRSSTIGKVTSTVKTNEYDDGSYCVPTVLYCG